MSRKTRQAGAFALAATMIVTFAGAIGSGAFAQDPLQGAIQTEDAVLEAPLAGEEATEQKTGAIRFVSKEVVQPLPEDALLVDSLADPANRADSLQDLVAAIPTEGELSKDMQCLAGAVYFESRGEPLRGQLAVARVIVNRAESSKFPESYCGVVYQRSQFSFVRGGSMPAINTASKAWHKAKAIARVAHEGLWDSPAKGALYFHATYVKPRWRLTRVARVDTHIFYR